MAAKAIAMEQLKQVLHLAQQGQSIKGIARLTGLARNTVRTYLARGVEQGSDPAVHTDAQLAAQLYDEDTSDFKSARYQQLLQHLESADTELVKTGVTRQLLWREYLEQHPDGYGYSQYCYYLQQMLAKKDVTMHLEYQPGEQTMIDFAGKKYPYVDKQTGELLTCEVFVATLPYSGLIFCYPVPSQKTADLLDACNRMVHYVGGVTQTILSDNLRTAVTKTDRYEPGFTDLCYQLSEHYGTTFSATRPARPLDKAMVEKAVNLVYRNVYAPLRRHTFGSIEEIAQAFLIQLDKLNLQPYKGSSFSRRSLFTTYEQPLLGELPSSPLLLKKAVVLTVQRNYHVQLREEGRYYSVPWQYVGKKVKVWYDAKTVEVYCDHQRIAVHPRSRSGQAYTTLFEHMPPNHQKAREMKGWTREELLSKAVRVGPATAQVAEKILSNSIYMEQNYKSCFGLLMLEKRFGKDRLETACTLALTGMRINYTLIKNILHAGTDRQIPSSQHNPLPIHANIRGPQQYQ
jgi:transposase